MGAGAALDGGEDGLDYYRMMIPEAGNYLKENGYLILEIGMGQSEQIKEMAEEAGFEDIRVKDYAGIERILIAQKGVMMGIIEDNRRLEDLDKKYIWHPFTQMKEWLEEKPIIISGGRDCFIKDIYGRWYLDGVSSFWVNIFGHRKKEIDDAIKEQLDKISP